MKCFSHFVVFHKNPHCGEFLSKVLAKEKTQEVSRNQAEAIEAGVAIQEFNKKRDLSSKGNCQSRGDLVAEKERQDCKSDSLP